MASPLIRSSRSERRSPFFRDLATPVSAHRHSSGGGGTAAATPSGGRFATPGQAAAVSALWRENFSSAEPPPPPAFTLEDRRDFSPEPGLPPLPSPAGSRTPSTPVRGYFASSPSPLKPREETNGDAAAVAAATPASAADGGLQVLRQQSTAGGSVWWSPAKSAGAVERSEKGKGSPVDGVVNPGALIVLPPPREVAKPEVQQNSFPLTEGIKDEEEWVTVFGFSLGDTNLVLHEFEKCGVILKHVLGPRDANWMHILYQSRYDARKALAKHGTQLNSVLIIGVKPVDSLQRQYLYESLESNNNRGFMVSVPGESAGTRSYTAASPFHQSPHHHHPNLKDNTFCKISQKGPHQTGAIASPTRSVVSKVMDLMFGI